MNRLPLCVCVIVFLLASRGLYSQNEKPVTPTPFTFVVVGDTRKANPFERLRLTIVNNTRQLIANKIAQSNPAFVVNTGDIVLKGSNRSHWADFENMNKALLTKKTPYYPVLGNHEYRGNEKEGIEDYFMYFKFLNHQLWYTITYSNCALIMLDSNFTRLSKEQVSQQDKWLEKTLDQYQSNSNIKFVFAFAHHPPFTNSRFNRPDKDIQQNFVTLFEKFSKVKFVFTGHVHTYERFKQNGINYVVTGGGGAPLVSLLPKEKWRYTDVYDDTLKKPRGTHFCLVTIGADFIELRTKHIDPVKLTWVDGDDYREQFTDK